jgi:pyrroloquinoline quinone (PQQ) biosynthesis protein C
MSDNLQKSGPQDRSRINVNESWELKHWTEALGVSKEQLEAAVKAVGTSVSAVKAHLGK